MFARHPCDEAIVLSAPDASSQRSGRWVLAITILGSSLTFIDGTVVNVALPVIQNDLRGNAVDLQWIIESYALFLGALLLLGGALGDLYGRKKLFVAGVAIFGAASLCCGLAAGIRQLIWARSVQGIGAALLVPNSLALLSATFDGESRGRAIGTWSGFGAITTGIGPILGGWLIGHASWRYAFFINVPLAAAIIVASLWRMPESRNRNAKRLDWPGGLLVTTGLGGLVFGFLESSNRGWHDAAVISAFAIGLILLLGFLLVESRSAEPMFPLDLFRSRNFSGANVLTLLLYAALSGTFFLVPLDLIQVQHYSTTRAGAALSPLVLLMFFLSRWSGGLIHRYGAKLPLVIGPLIATAGFLLFSLPSLSTNYWTSFFPAVTVLGVGMAVTVAPLTTAVMNSVERDRVGIASGINNAASRIAGLLAVAVLGAAMVAFFRHAFVQYLENYAIAPDIKRQLYVQAIRLAGITLPPQVGQEVRNAIENLIWLSFVSGFRRVMWICAALAFLSSVTAWFAMPGKPVARAAGSPLFTRDNSSDRQAP